MSAETNALKKRLGTGSFNAATITSVKVVGFGGGHIVSGLGGDCG